jgi:hypothetical protein
MRSFRVKIPLALLIITIFLGLRLHNHEDQIVFAQLPTGSVPTVTGTPSGPVVTIRPTANEDFVNVRSGPNALYPRVGVLLSGQTAPAKGRSPGSEWILIEYPGAPGGVGWVYAAFLSMTPGELPIVEPPPTPTPEMTNTIDPTLAAQFIVTVAPTRLPTFTPPPALVIPTFPSGQDMPITGGVPMGFVIVILFTVGVLLGVFSLVQRR